MPKDNHYGQERESHKASKPSGKKKENEKIRIQCTMNSQGHEQNDTEQEGQKVMK